MDAPTPGPGDVRRAEVAVVGAGPVGLSLALGLARAGRRVVVLEKRAGTADHSRAPAIWPRTQEILDELGVMGAFSDHGIALRRIRLRDADAAADGDADGGAGRVLLSLPVEELSDETPFPRLLVVPQSETERMLHEAVAAEPSAELLFSARVTDVEQRGGTVRLTYRHGGSRRVAEGDFAVGCDGAHSTVREALGASFDGRTYRTRAALADVRLRSQRDLPFPRLTTRPRLAVAIRIDRRLWRLILPFPPRVDRPLEERVNRAVRSLLAPEAAEGFESVWQSEFRLHRRVSSRFVAGRVALAGDAAHLNSPVGGQGMNAGIQDASALTRTLVDALRAGDPGLLERYERTRRAAIEGGVNPFTDRLTRALLLGDGRLVRPLLRAADLALRIGPLRRRFLRRLAMLDRPAGDRAGPGT